MLMRKLFIKFLTLLLSPIFLSNALAQLPTELAVIHGSADISGYGNSMTITNTPNTILDWQSFSIGPENHLHFQQHDSNSLVLNRVLGNNPSEILGKLTSNGGVWLINPYGILFGPDARIDLTSLVASTHDISNIDFLAHRYHFFSEHNTGELKNLGEIRTNFGGRVWLIGNHVQNEGLVYTPQGQIVLAAGKKIELIDSAVPNISVEISAPNSSAVNIGSLVASNGTIDIHGSIVNQEGIIRANSIATAPNGHISLKADNLTLGSQNEIQAENGTIHLEANTKLIQHGNTSGREITLSAPQILQQGKITAPGGNINLFAHNSIQLAGSLDASTPQDTGGKIQLITDTLSSTPNSSIYADGQQGGHIKIIGNQSVSLSTSLSAVGTLKGGFVELTGNSIALHNASIDTSGNLQGGTIHIGGGWQGSGSLPHAREVLIGAGSEIKANGVEGQQTKGGEVVVWSTQLSNQAGLIQAKDGGRVELSSQGSFFQSGEIQVGKHGLIFYDPKNIIITRNTPSQPISQTSYIEPIAIENPLFNGSNVVLQASNDITVDSGISLDSFSEGNPFGNLTLQSGRNISINQSISAFNTQITAISGDISAKNTNSNLTEPGTPTLTISQGARINPGIDGTVTLAAVDGNFINNSSSDQGIGSIGRWHIYASNPTLSQEGSIGAPFNRHFNQAFIFGSEPDYATTGNWFFYSLAPILRVSPSSESIIYGQSIPLFKPQFTGFLEGDTPENTITGSTQWQIEGEHSTTSNPVAGQHDVSYLGGLISQRGYTIIDDQGSSNELTINPAEISVSNFTAENKTYDRDNKILVDGTAFLSGAIDDDDVQLTGEGLLNDWNVGTNKPVTINFQNVTLSGADGKNYQLRNFTSATTTADITPKHLVASNFIVSNKVYDDNFSANLTKNSGALSGVIDGDIVSLSGGKAIFTDKEVGKNIAVNITDIALNGENKSNYLLETTDIVPAKADIIPATLTYIADPTIRAAGTEMTGFKGKVTGFVGDDTLEKDTNGVIAWRTNATNNAAKGLYAIQGTGLEARNYQFVQAESNQFALTVDGVDDHPQINPIQKLPLEMKRGEDAVQRSPEKIGKGKVIDKTSTELTFSTYPNFGPIHSKRMSRDQMYQLIIDRKLYKEKLFAEAIYKLEIDPRLADVPICPSIADIDKGDCRISGTQRVEYKTLSRNTNSSEQAHSNEQEKTPLNKIKRRFALLIGIDQYTDQAIPTLANAISDIEALGKMLNDEMHYEIRPIKNASRETIIKILNELAIEMETSDSVIVYYAGHGYFNDKTGGGYWIPANALVTNPSSWISNTSISEMLSTISANQIFMISDSCYSGAFTKEQKFNFDQLDIDLDKRSVIAMASGGDEPVADDGLGGHSIFAWYFMQALRNVNNWEPAKKIYEQVRNNVINAFPQTPQFGGIISAGHLEGDYAIIKKP